MSPSFTPRPKQKAVLAYRQGYMGVAAVPGAGKTHTLSRLAAELIAAGLVQGDQEVLIVTLVNSAVENFAGRISAFVQAGGLLPHLGYRVRTLHGLAHDIVRERPALAGLSDDFQIIDERAAELLRNEAAQAWLKSNPNALDDYLDPEMDENRREWARREQLPGLVQELAGEFIRSAKDLQLTSEALAARLAELSVPLPLAELGCAVYADYQRALAYRGAVDFDDLIRLALLALRSDAQYLARLQARWPYILEDEAQDSSRLQEEILALLAGPQGNWVRVGDPNQAIYETFTTASPEHLRRFMQRPDVTARELPNSGRSTRSIIKLANYLIDWTRGAHPWPAVRTALDHPLIQPTPRGDPQPNPPDDPGKLRIILPKLSPAEEIRAVADSLERWLPENPEATVAVLAPRNQRGFELIDELKRRGLPYFDGLMRSTSETRRAAGALGNLLKYLANPGSAALLSTAYKVWRRDVTDPEPRVLVDAATELLRKCTHVEDYLAPRPDWDWLEGLGLDEAQAALYQELIEFRTLARRWQGAALLPIDQALLTLAQDLFSAPSDLALAHKLAGLLRRAAEAHPGWRLPEMTEELAVVARNERRFLGFSQDDTGFDPERYKGVVVPATIHKAKGLEWDRVYLMSVSNYDFPSGDSYDRYIAEKWFLRDKLNLGAEALAQLQAALSANPYEWYQEGAATQQARVDYVAERLRLLYVGLTRAKKELIMTWNTGRNGDMLPSQPLIALEAYLARLQAK